MQHDRTKNEGNKDALSLITTHNVETKTPALLMKYNLSGLSAISKILASKVNTLQTGT